jgi:hypothetical protein
MLTGLVLLVFAGPLQIERFTMRPTIPGKYGRESPGPWLEETHEGLWGDQILLQWMNPREKDSQAYAVSQRIAEDNRPTIDWFVPSGYPPPVGWPIASGIWVRDSFQTIRLISLSLTAWLAVTLAAHGVLEWAHRGTGSTSLGRGCAARAGLVSLRRACIIPLRATCVGALMISAIFLLAPDATRTFRHFAYYALLAIGTAGPVLVAIRPVCHGSSDETGGLRGARGVAVLILVPAMVLSLVEWGLRIGYYQLWQWTSW